MAFKRLLRPIQVHKCAMRLTIEKEPVSLLAYLFVLMSVPVAFCQSACLLNVASSTLLSNLKPLIRTGAGSRHQGQKGDCSILSRLSTQRSQPSSIQSRSKVSSKSFKSSNGSFNRWNHSRSSYLDHQINTTLSRSFWTSITMSEGSGTFSSS